MNQGEMFFCFRDENEEKRAVPVTTVIPEVKRKKESGQRLLREKTTASTTVLKQQENKSKETNAATVTAAAMAATKAKKQLLKIVPEDKIVFNPPFTRFLILAFLRQYQHRKITSVFPLQTFPSRTRPKTTRSRLRSRQRHQNDTVSGPMWAYWNRARRPMWKCCYNRARRTRSTSFKCRV